MKKGFNGDIEALTLSNTDFRRVVYTAKHSQLVLMSIAKGEEIGEEVHTVDQFFRIEAGEGKAVIDGIEHPLTEGVAVLVPAGARHNVINTGTDALKLYTIYAPAQHKDGLVNPTKKDAEENDQEFDGKTTEA